tara:strand:+ start:9 stop:1091 length:1083 start_codon:yes stop_codon:yes gene_type:complete
MTKTFKDYLKEAENESGLQYYTGVKKHGKEYMKKAAKAGREGASQEELGRLKDKYSKAEKKKESIEVKEAKACNCNEDCPCGGNCTPDCNCGPECGTNESIEVNRVKELAGIQTNEETYDDSDKQTQDGKPTDEEILALADRYKQYEGGNGDSLLGGYIQYMTNTGVPLDSIEEKEWNKWVERNPDEEFPGMDVLDQEPENFPITVKFRNDLFKMYKGMPDEDDVHRISDVLDGVKDESTKELSDIKKLSGLDTNEETYDGDDFYNNYGDMWYNEDEVIDEAEYQGRKVKLGKPMRGDVKKFKVYVRDPKTKNIKKVNFGDPNMKIKKSNPARRRSFRARHNCDNPGPRTKARYWSCRKW